MNQDHSPPDAPELRRLIDLIAAENPLQRKAIEKFVSRQDARYWTFAEEVCAGLNQRFLTTDADRRGLARAYNELCKELNAEQFRFKKTGTYQTRDASAANAAVYSQPERMRLYCLGLMLSHLFWKSHYEMILFLQRHLDRPVSRCLEVGVGHGLLVHELIRRQPEAMVTALDISPASLQLAREILGTFGVDVSRIEFVQADFLASTLPARSFDFLIMGEVLEHVDEPSRFLEAARRVLTPEGRLYVSTCANCPAPDHVYLFRNVREIRELIEGSGLRIVADVAIPLEDVPESDWERRRVNVNYAAVCEPSAVG